VSFALRAARVLTPGHELEDTWVTVDEGLITAVGAEPPAHAHRLDLGDCDLIPGLVDLHSDCLEERAHPRPSSPLPLGAALLHLDAEVAAHAITTHFLCASFEDDAAQHRSPARAAEIVRTVRAWRRQLRVEHRVHLRIETSVDELDRAGALAADDAVGLVSYMDHSPGQGQYPDERAWRAHFAERLGHDGPAVAELAARRLAAQADGDARRRRIAALALRAGAVLASHDDAGEEDVARAVALGTAISEFPLNAHAARTASSAGGW
jgi:alpha-D-ribose 1-methylphosphonate 5-triphosphate diphosphatase